MDEAQFKQTVKEIITKLEAELRKMGVDTKKENIAIAISAILAMRLFETQQQMEVYAGSDEFIEMLADEIEKELRSDRWKGLGD